MISLDVGIVGAVDRAESSLARDAALEFFRRLVPERLFEWIGAAADENRAGQTESDGEGLQARRILKEVISDK